MLCEFKLSHSAAEAARNIALAFGTDSPSERTVRCWFAKFSSGDFDLEDKPGRGRRMSLDDQALRAAVETKPDTTTRTLAAGLAVHYATVSKHLASIGMVGNMSDGNLPEVLSTGITGINDADTRFMQDELGGRSLTMCHFIIFNFCVGFFGYYIWLIFPRPKSNETYRTNQKPSGESR
ncbi:hypothetical protein Y032_0228g2876 [Ancylostoma ceylanicum]|nr:hypothetical protein Y032_0228g2876 [Ancylostoma ceylanicum]